MKNYYISTLLLLLFSATTFGQATRSSVRKASEIKEKTYRNKQRDSYHHWSLEANVGFNKPVEPFTTGYYASDPERFANIGVVDHYSLATRYMTSNVFGFKVGLNYDGIKNLSSSMSPNFKLTLYTATFEGVLNLGRICRFETFTSRFNFLAHAGVHTTYKTLDSRDATPGLYNTIGYRREQDGGVVFGLTPEYRISKRIFLIADFTMVSNFRQHINWDGSKTTDNNLNGRINYTTLGLVVSLGKDKNKEHADWFIPETIDSEALKRLQEVETMVADMDRDGVPDYRDLQNNTPAGVTVDSKGRSIDLNKNGVPDELEKTTTPVVNNNNVVVAPPVNNNSSVVSTADNDVIKELIEKGYYNIFFDISKDYPNDGSTANVYHIIHYLKLNSTAKVRLVGHADKTGDVVANKNLSERRAKSIFNLISGSGISANRIKIEGLGVDNNVPSDVRSGNNMARRVSVIVEK